MNYNVIDRPDHITNTLRRMSDAQNVRNTASRSGWSSDEEKNQIAPVKSSAKRM
jgi:hypothetical protein